jgi:hypothetical protein
MFAGLSWTSKASGKASEGVKWAVRPSETRRVLRGRALPPEITVSTSEGLGEKKLGIFATAKERSVDGLKPSG